MNEWSGHAYRFCGRAGGDSSRDRQAACEPACRVSARRPGTSLDRSGLAPGRRFGLVAKSRGSRICADLGLSGCTLRRHAGPQLIGSPPRLRRHADPQRISSPLCKGGLGGICFCSYCAVPKQKQIPRATRTVQTSS
ncbi:hypothetical protein LC55x_1848 [Lysobacter capsici]|nr:hypothetical protein LC55x_1848 [Lysobacter capsici]